MSWEKLITPSTYGPEEYFVLSLIVFVVFVMLKHLIYHTLYYWWYREGRLYIPMKWQNFVSGKTLPQRITHYVKQNSTDSKGTTIDTIVERIEDYSSNIEFSLTIGKEKGAVLDKVVSERQPNTALVCGSLCGYSVLRILKASPKCHVYVIESDIQKCAAIEQLIQQAKQSKQVTVLAATPVDVIPKLSEEYGIKNLDFVFLTSTSLSEPTHHQVLQLLEKHNLFYKNESGTEGPNTVILADKVVHFGENEFLKYVRYSENYATEYHQMPLEYSPYDIVDGMEKAVYVGA